MNNDNNMEIDPIIDKIMGSIKTENKLPTFKMRTRGKNIEIQINLSIN